MGYILDKALIERAQAGDREALRQLIEATQTRLYRFCLVICGDAARAEDLAQEAYLKVFDNLSKIAKPEAFMDWLFRTTRNLHIDQMRRHTETPIAPEDMEEREAHSSTSEDLAVHEVLSQFEPDDRWLILLIDMENYSYFEAAEHLGLSEDAVRSRIFRLRKEFIEKWKNLETK